MLHSLWLAKLSPRISAEGLKYAGLITLKCI
jgi:hypothetical protein